MATNINHVEELENSFESCLASLTNQSFNQNYDSEEIKTSVEQCIQRFLDSAKTMEAFFLQKRFLLANQKPEQIIIEDINDIKNEITRVDQILQRNYEKLQTWQSLLCDVSLSSNPSGNLSAQPVSTPVPVAPQVPHLIRQQSIINHPQVSIPGNTTGIPPQLGSPQIRHPSHMLQSPNTGITHHPVPQPQSIIQQQQQTIPSQIPVPPQQPSMMHIQQTQGVMAPPGQANIPHANAQQQQSGIIPQMVQGAVTPNPVAQMQQQQQYMHNQNQSTLQGPLAYLERTTSSIGMPENRR